MSFKKEKKLEKEMKKIKSDVERKSLVNNLEFVGNGPNIFSSH